MRFLQTGTKAGMVPAEIMARGTEAVEAFNGALAEGEVEVNQGRTVFMGLERVGKTSTIKSFLRNTFDPNEGITDAIANTTVCTHESHDELNWKETSPDQSGASGMYEAKMADSIAKKMLEKETEENVEITRQSMLSPIKAETKHSQGQSSLNIDANDPKMVSDIQEQTQTQSMEEVPENIATKVQERIQALKFTRGNATQERQKSGNDFIMSIWDFGGQPIYHVIQRIFMVSFAIVCVVFNLEDDLDSPAKVRDPTTGKMYQHRMTNLEFILYWIRSVYTNSRDSKLDDGQVSPPVLVIGTHLGSLQGNDKEQKRKSEEIFSKIREALEGKPYEALVYPTFFAIENSLPFAGSHASNIMDQILKFAKKMVRKLPLKWLLVQQKIQQLKLKNIYLPTNEVIALVERCGVKKGAQKVLLEYLHDLGEILYFPDDKALKDIIVLDVMKLVDMFKTIITVIDPKFMEPKHRKAWRTLDSGILREHLLKHLWTKFSFSDKTFNFFVSLMQKFGLVCEKKNTKGGERIFYVLSRLRPECVKTLPMDYGKRAVSIFHDFGGYLPDDLFQRGVTKFIEKFQVEDYEPTLSYEHVELHINQLHQVVLNVATIKHRRMFKTTIIRRNILNPTQLTKEEEPSTAVCKKVLSFLETELKIFCKSDARGIELTRYIACECRDAHMHIVRKFNNDVLPCGSNGMEVTHYRRLFGEEPLYRRLLMKFKLIWEGLSQNQQAVNNSKGFADDAIIATVSENFNFSWRRFGVRLGLDWCTVNKFSADHTQTTGEAVENMMNYWRSSCSSDIHQRKELCTALKLHGFSSLADKLFEGEIGDETLVTQQAGKCFNDQDLLFICDKLDSGSWRILGVRLGLKWTGINKIAHNNRKVEDCIMELLVTWRDKQSKSQQLPIMMNALRRQQLAGLARSVCERHGYSDESEAAPTQINVPQIPTPVQGNYFDDQDLLLICDNLEAKYWRRLGVRLGLKWTLINKIASNYNQVEDCIMELLVNWRDNQSTNQVPIMVNSLRQQKLHGLAKSVCERHGYGYEDTFEVSPTQINLPQIPTPVQGFLSDIHMVFISEQLDNDWKNLGIYLHLESSEINRIESDFSPPSVDACIEMLVQWRNQEAEVNHLETISEALNQLERIDIKEKLELCFH